MATQAFFFNFFLFLPRFTKNRGDTRIEVLHNHNTTSNGVLATLSWLPSLQTLIASSKMLWKNWL